MEKLKYNLKKYRLTFIFLGAVFCIIAFNIFKNGFTKEGLFLALIDSEAALNFIDKILYGLLLILAITVILGKIVDFAKDIIYKKMDIQDDIDFEEIVESYEYMPHSQKRFKMIVFMVGLVFSVFFISIMLGIRSDLHIQGFLTYITMVIIFSESVISSKAEFIESLLMLNEKELIEFSEYVNSSEEINDKKEILKYVEKVKDRENTKKKISVMKKVRTALIVFSVMVVIATVYILFKSF